MAAPAHIRPVPPSRVRVLLATERPAVARLFTGRPAVSATATMRVNRAELDGVGEELADAEAAVVDAGLEPVLAAELCAELRRRRPDLPVAAVVCCPHALTPWDLRGLLETGVSAVLDLHLGEAEAERTIESIARGASILHLQLRRGHRDVLRELLGDHGQRSEHSLRLLELVSLGLPDHEIGRQLHLSPHTVKRHIEQTRRELGLRNRLELAAWAGRHGFYLGGRGGDVVPVLVTRPRG